MTRKARFELILFTACLPFLASSPARAAETLYRFTGGPDGGSPAGPLVADPAGNLYGVASSGGAGFGLVFELSPPASPSAPWTQTILYNFTSADGPSGGGLTRDGRGNLYGVTNAAVFRLSPAASGTPWSYSVLFRFPSGDWLPTGSLALDPAGNLYGSTQYGGPHSLGQVYELSPPPNSASSWAYHLIHPFQGVDGGYYPYGGLVLDRYGTVYGVTTRGGAGNCTDGEGTHLGCGTVFQLAPASSGWNETVVYSFTAHQNNMPLWGPTIGSGPALYGTATYDVYRLAPPASHGQAWRYQTIYQFTEGISGTMPDCAVIFDASGNLYGTSASSGLSGYSTAFKLTPPTEANALWTETTLANFSTGFNLGYPYGGLVLGKLGALYGVTVGNGETDFGSVFAVMP